VTSSPLVDSIHLLPEARACRVRRQGVSACTTSAVTSRQCVYYYYVIAECGGGHVLLATGLCYIVYLNKMRAAPSAAAASRRQGVFQGV